MQYHCPLQTFVVGRSRRIKIQTRIHCISKEYPKFPVELPHHSCYWVAYNGRLPEPTPHIAERTNGDNYIKITYIYIYMYTKEDKYTYVQHILYVYVYMYMYIVNIYIYMYTYTQLHTCIHLQKHNRANRYR